MRTKLANLADVAIVLASVVVAGMALRGNSDAQGPIPSNTLRVTDIGQETWRRLLAERSFTDAEGARISVVQFADMECPFCRRFDEVLVGFSEDNPGLVREVFLHFPLQSHRFARIAAQTVECGINGQEKRRLMSQLFKVQDSLGLIDWSAFGERAKVSNLERFERCLNEPEPAIIQAHRALGDSLAVSGTPTVFVNGKRWSRAPTRVQLDSILHNATEGR